MTETRLRLSAIPMSVSLISSLWCALLLGASLVWPIGYGYDEPRHVDMAYVYSANPFHFYAPGHLMQTRGSAGLQHLLPGVPPTKRLAVAPTSPRSQRP